MVLITFQKLKLLESTVKSVPSETPKRRDIICNRFEASLSKWQKEEIENDKKHVLIDVDIGLRFKRHQFSINDKAQFSELLKVCENSLETIENQFSKVFLPKKSHCCGKSLTLKKPTSGLLHNGSKCRVFTFQGVKESQIFTATCQECFSKYTCFYEEELFDETKIRRFFKPNNYFATTADTVFSVDLLEHITNMTLICSSEFRNTAETLNRTLFQKDNLQRNALSDIFFAFNLAQKLPMCPLVVKQNKDRNTLVDYFCSQAAPLLRKVCSDPYLKHICTFDPSCKNRAAVIDGNEKNTR